VDIAYFDGRFLANSVDFIRSDGDKVNFRVNKTCIDEAKMTFHVEKPLSNETEITSNVIRITSMVMRTSSIVMGTIMTLKILSSDVKKVCLLVIFLYFIVIKTNTTGVKAKERVIFLYFVVVCKKFVAIISVIIVKIF
jgi:hypothetical protein